MRIFHIVISNHDPLENYEIRKYTRQFVVQYFKMVCMLNTLSTAVETNDCGTVNLIKNGEKGYHWVASWKRGSVRIYFDSYGQITPVEIQKYLKTAEEFCANTNVIQRNTDIVQPLNSSICGQLCLYVLKALSEGWSYEKILTVLRERKLTYTH